MAQINMVGYHGTLEHKANAIVKTQTFIPSTKNTEWLGSGVYFFKHLSHAKDWAEQEAGKQKNKGRRPSVLKAFLECDDTQIFDLDDPENIKELDRFVDAYIKNMGERICVDLNDDRKLWCLSCELCREIFPNIAIIMYTFPKQKMKGAAGFRANQTQLCVSKDKTNVIKKIEKWSETI